LSNVLAVLRERGIVPPCRFEKPSSEAEKWVKAFDEHLDHVLGLKSTTRSHYVRVAERLMDFRFGDRALEWSSLTIEVVTEFLRKEALLCEGSVRPVVVTALRVVLGFLVNQGAIRPGLEAAIPRVRRWKLASLPRHVSGEEVERVLRVCKDGTRRDVRDRAVVTVLGRLGLRAGEVAGIELNDLDWIGGSVRIRAGKSSVERSLPLSQEVGAAIADYLMQARPKSTSRHMFLRCVAPFTPLSASAISGIARERLKQAGVDISPSGAHVFRHTAATLMVHRGATFKEVADVLGHQHLKTTHIYAKLDLRALARVAMPWPGGVR
jgi:integrase